MNLKAFLLVLGCCASMTFAQQTVQITIDASKDAKPISPYIYGANFNTLENSTLNRGGGNRHTAYNWENNASNAGADWQHQNDNHMVQDSQFQDRPGEPAFQDIQKGGKAGIATIVTVPMAGYVSADKNGDGDVNKTPNYLQTRFKKSVAKKNAPFTLTPDLTDDFVYQDEFVNWAEKHARVNAEQQIWYSLDNEPDIWQGTHARIRPTNITYAELIQRTTDWSSAIKDVAPNTMIFGAVNYGWQGYVRLQDAPDANNRDFHEVFLAEMKKAEEKAGKRLVDVLDIHWYPEAQGGGKRIAFQGKSEPAVAQARVQAPRSLWDPTYVETSWITQSLGGKPIALLPRVMGKIDKLYPGTKLSITEYNYGGADHISGAIAEADVLGLFGKHGVFAACYWPLEDSRPFAQAAFNAYRNFDGKGAMFGDTSVFSETSDNEKSAVHASIDSTNPNRMVIVLINRSEAPITAKLNGISKFTTGEAFQITGDSAKPKSANFDVQKMEYVMPAMSVTTLSLK